MTYRFVSKIVRNKHDSRHRLVIDRIHPRCPQFKPMKPNIQLLSLANIPRIPDGIRTGPFAKNHIRPIKHALTYGLIVIVKRAPWINPDFKTWIRVKELNKFTHEFQVVRGNTYPYTAMGCDNCTTFRKCPI